MNLETERLLLRQWHLDDFESYASYYSDKKLARFVGGQCEREDAWRKMASLAGHWTLRGFGYWALEEKNSGDFVGCAGLWQSDGWPEVELGYWLMAEKQGFGFASEAGSAAKQFAVATVGVTSLVSYIDPDNTPSIRVAERLGAYLDGTIELLTFGLHYVYRYDLAGL